MSDKFQVLVRDVMAKPIAFGINGPGMTKLQAMDRIEKGRDAVDAVVKMLKRLE